MVVSHVEDHAKAAAAQQDGFDQLIGVEELADIVDKSLQVPFVCVSRVFTVRLVGVVVGAC